MGFNPRMVYIIWDDLALYIEHGSCGVILIYFEGCSMAMFDYLRVSCLCVFDGNILIYMLHIFDVWRMQMYHDVTIEQT